MILPLSKSSSARQAKNMDKNTRITQGEEDIFNLPAEGTKKQFTNFESKDHWHILTREISRPNKNENYFI